MENTQKDSSIYLGLDINMLQLIGQGCQGKVYLLPENKVLKVYYSMDSCKSQLEILQKGQDSRFFPTVYDHDKHSIIMSFVQGITLSKYLRHNNIGKPLSMELVKLIEEFKSLKFTRLDIRPHHIFIQANKTIKIIDPRDNFKIVQPYPLLMLKGLERHDALDEFFNNIKDDYPDYYNYWSNKMR